MLVIRLRRIGKKNKPTYRVVVAEHSYPIDGKFTADLGYYNPHSKKISLDLKEVTVWLDKGAQPSNTIAKLLQKEKVKHTSVVVHQRNRKAKAEKAPKVSVKAADAPISTDEVPTPETTESDSAVETTTDTTEPTVPSDEVEPVSEPVPTEEPA